nr:hypothetical protein [Tanacetum cinerariifolium]
MLSRISFHVLIRQGLITMDCCSCLDLLVADGNGAITLMMSLGLIYMEVSREGYLEDAAGINFIENAYYQCLRVNTYFVLAIDVSFSRANGAILMA